MFTVIQSNNKEIIKWLLEHGFPCLTYEYNIGPCDRPQALLDLCTRANITF